MRGRQDLVWAEPLHQSVDIFPLFFCLPPTGSSEVLAAGWCGWVPGPGCGESDSEYPFHARSRAWVRTEAPARA